MNIDPITGKILTAPQAQPPAPQPMGQVVKAAPAVSKVTHILAGILAAVAAFALTPAGQALIAQYPHLAVVGGLLSTLSALYKSPQADA